MIKRGLHKTLAEVGKIKTGFKGEKIKSRSGAEFSPPKKFDHFVITTTERQGGSKDGNLLVNERMMAKVGKEPRELKIRLPFDSIDKNFFTQYQAYNGGKKVCAGDGETATRRGEVTVKGDKLEVKEGPLHEVACDYATCPIAQAGKCKVSGILSVFLPQSGDLGGVYKYRTHSWNGVSSILSALEYFAENTGGILQGMPLKLVLVKKTTEEHGSINYATLVIDGEEIFGLRQRALEEKKSRALLGYDISKAEAEAEASGILEDTDPEDEVEAEFYAHDQPGVSDRPPAKPEKGTSAADVERKLAPAPAAVHPVAEGSPAAAAPKGGQQAQTGEGQPGLDIF